MTDTPRWRSFVALGDSMTEGLQDLDSSGTPIGWADRLAQGLADRAGEPIRYANLAIRGRLLGQILDEQVEPALALKPDLVSLWGGGNDMLRPSADPDQMAADVEQAVIRFRQAGADVLLGLGADPRDSPVIKLTRPRVAVYNLNLVGIARAHGAYVVDGWNLPAIRDWRMWHEDRLHLTAAGHELVAQAALVSLGLEPSRPDWDAPLPPVPPLNFRESVDWNLVWGRDHLAPWLGRRLHRTSSGAGRTAKYPDYEQVEPVDLAN